MSGGPLAHLVWSMLAAGSVACTFEGATTTGVDPSGADAGGQLDAALQCADPPADIVAWWDGEMVGEDRVGGADATAIRGAPTDATGLVGGATRFGVDDIFEINPAPTPALFTLEAWIRVEQANPDGWIGFYGRFGQASASLYQNRLTYWEGDAGGIDGNLALGDVVQTNVWHHVAITWDGVNATTYLDGTLSAQQSVGVSVNLPAEVGVGGIFNDQSELRDAFVGLIDELTLYSRALEGAEIARIVAAGAAGKCK